MSNLGLNRKPTGYLDLEQRGYNKTDFDKNGGNWLQLGRKYFLFKGKSNDRDSVNRQNFMELLVSASCNLLKVPCASYDLAQRLGVKGVIMEDFCDRSFEYYTDLDTFLNNQYRGQENREKRVTLSRNIVKLRELFTEKYGSKKANELVQSLAEYMAVDSYFYLSGFNYGLITDARGNVRMAPKYSNGSMLGSDMKEEQLREYTSAIAQSPNNTSYYIATMLNQSLQTLGDQATKAENRRNDIHPHLSYSENTTHLRGMRLLAEACEEEPELFLPVVRKLASFDANEAIRQVEEKTGVEFPGVLRDWVLVVSKHSQQQAKELLNRYKEEEQKHDGGPDFDE